MNIPEARQTYLSKQAQHPLLGLVWAAYTRKVPIGLSKIEVNLSHTHERSLEASNPGLTWLLYEAIKVHSSFASLECGSCRLCPIGLTAHHIHTLSSMMEEGTNKTKHNKKPKPKIIMWKPPYNNFTCTYQLKYHHMTMTLSICQEDQETTFS